MPAIPNGQKLGIVSDVTQARTWAIWLTPLQQAQHFAALASLLCWKIIETVSPLKVFGRLILEHFLRPAGDRRG